MLRKIAAIAFLTGAGHLFSIWVLKYLSFNTSLSDLGWIGSADALLFFLINLITAGLQPTAMRDIALHNNWSQIYARTQSARITLAFILTIFVLLAFWDSHYIIVLSCVLIATNGDYALYGLGKPVHAAALAFVRLIIPYASAVIALYTQPQLITQAFLVGILFSYIITNSITAILLKQPLLFSPSLKHLKLYTASLPLGIVGLSSYFIGLGLMLLTPYFYANNTSSTAVIFIGLKFYMILKGLLRIIHQAWLREMKEINVSRDVDALGMILSSGFLFFISVFPKSFISLFFGSQFQTETFFFILLAVAFFVYSTFSSLTTRALLEKKDNPYAFISALGAIVTILLFVVTASFAAKPWYVALSVLAGEFVFSMLMIWHLKAQNELLMRIQMLLKIFVCVAAPFLIYFYVGDTKSSFYFALFSFAFVTLLMNVKFFKKVY
jgi:O-antigen/teichoic acid export membrane protein